jgi:hypothetical protein
MFLERSRIGYCGSLDQGSTDQFTREHGVQCSGPWPGTHHVSQYGNTGKYLRRMRCIPFGPPDHGGDKGYRPRVDPVPHDRAGVWTIHTTHTTPQERDGSACCRLAATRPTSSAPVFATGGASATTVARTTGREASRGNHSSPRGVCCDCDLNIGQRVQSGAHRRS